MEPPLPLIEDHAVEAFVEMYRPWDDLATADTLMSDSQLRDELAAWPRYGYPDPLPQYKQLLIEQGFRPRIDPSTHCPCIPVRYAEHEADITVSSE